MMKFSIFITKNIVNVIHVFSYIILKEKLISKIKMHNIFLHGYISRSSNVAGIEYLKEKNSISYFF